MKNGKRIYIQVSDDISKEETLLREVNPLSSVNDYYPKMIIARTKNDVYDFHGIEIVDIARWLLGE